MTGTSAALLPWCLSNFRTIAQFKYKSRDFETLRDLEKNFVDIDIETEPMALAGTPLSLFFMNIASGLG